MTSLESAQAYLERIWRDVNASMERKLREELRYDDRQMAQAREYLAKVQLMSTTSSLARYQHWIEAQNAPSTELH